MRSLPPTRTDWCKFDAATKTDIAVHEAEDEAEASKVAARHARRIRRRRAVAALR